ncbi:unnamed protein product [Toxocara canis]|uniref:Ovule protein n=1 Tax=Toxocara canis TaxID=6265 RepID=A0A183U7D1_TOXCA|nr:unnamed protein product [Toxocara canis]
MQTQSEMGYENGKVCRNDENEKTKYSNDVKSVMEKGKDNKPKKANITSFNKSGKSQRLFAIPVLKKTYAT